MKLVLVLVGLLVAVGAYITLAIVDTSAWPAWARPLTAFIGSSGVLTAFWDLIKAHTEHGYRLDEKSAENAFILSATSHMAQKAFDKHVEFCEKYVQEVNNGLMILFQEGPTREALNIAQSLSQIRRDFVLWETKNVALVLSQFEKALREMGADEHYLQHVRRGDERSKLIDKIYKTFKDVLGLDDLPNKPTGEIAAAHIIAQLQNHLGISELTDLRKHYLAEAMRRNRMKVLS
jgi:hypothetical protein